MRGALLLLLVIQTWIQTLSGSTVIYYDQAQWQAAINTQNAGALADISLASADWTSSFQASRSFDSLTSRSSTAVGELSVVAGYSPLGVANNALLGHVTNGAFSDTISKYGSTTFNFSEPIDAFGGNFNISGSNGLQIFSGSGPSFNTPGGNFNGFIGFLSDQSLSSVSLTWGQNGSCVPCFGNSYILSDFQVASDPVAAPEPSFKYPVAGLLLFVICFTALRRQ